MGCPIDHFTVEHITSTFVYNSYPFIEVLWFHRGQEKQDEIAKVITSSVREMTENPDSDVAVVFQELQKQNYYDNGVHY